MVNPAPGGIDREFVIRKKPTVRKTLTAATSWLNVPRIPKEFGCWV